jgi:hypothetical protein
MSEKAAWRRHVERRRRELHDDYPCAAPTSRRFCPKHRIRVPQQIVVRRRVPWTGRVHKKRIPLSGICKPCRDELYDRLAVEFDKHDAARRAA